LAPERYGHGERETGSILNTTQNTLATTIDLKQVEDLPTYGRDVSVLAFLVPGAVDAQLQ